jgi:hypothetical protein
MTDEEKVAAIIEACDSGRMSFHGGYPTDWTIRDGIVYWADLDGGKDYNRTQLVIRPVKEFIAEYAWVFEMAEEEDLDDAESGRSNERR